MFDNILNILVILGIIIFLCIGYFKLKYPFWSKQPVFHYYKLNYWLFPPGIIQEALPEKNKFYDYDVEFYNMNNIPTEKKDLFFEFIKNNFLPNHYEHYNPTNDAIIDNFIHHNDKSFLSLKIHENNILSCMTSKPLECYLDGNKMIINYVDYLCVQKKHRKKNYAGKQIYTHYCHTRNKSNNIVSLFKRESKNTMIVPLTVYKNYLFKHDNWTLDYDFNLPNINIVFINKTNMNKFYQIFTESKQYFECFISLNLGHIFYLIEKNHLIILALMINNTFQGYYVFKNPYTTYNNKKSLEFVSSYVNKNVDEKIFTLGFLISLNLVSKDIQSELVFIENISNNNIILKLLLEKYKPLNAYVNSYYFYNFAYLPKESKHIFCLV
jgi:hypothetical protein